MVADTPGRETAEALLARLRDARHGRTIACPRCAHVGIHRWGSFRGRQRYRCLNCARTFSDLTATPAAYTKKLGHWPVFIDCLAKSLSVRRAAAVTGISPSTSFRWRHAVLHDVRSRDATRLREWIEIGELRMAHSEKGNRNLHRAARRRGLSPGQLLASPPLAIVRVLIACDRTGRVASSVVRTRMVGSRDYEALLLDRLVRPVRIVAARGPLSAVGIFARRCGSEFHDARYPRRADADSPCHLRTIGAYVRRFVGWMERFRGVATKYLSNYLGWHQVLERRHQFGGLGVLLRWPLGEGVP